MIEWDEHWVEADHVSEEPVVARPEDGDHDEAQREGEVAVAHLVEE